MSTKTAPRTYYKTTFTVVALTREPYDPLCLDDLSYDVTGQGIALGEWHRVTQKKLTAEQVAEECYRVGSDPSYFQLVPQEDGAYVHEDELADDELPRRIVDATARHFGSTSYRLRTKGRTARIARARQVAMYLLSEDAGLGSTQTGRMLNRDHATCTYGHKVVAAAVARDDQHICAALRAIRAAVEQACRQERGERVG